MINAMALLFLLYAVVGIQLTREAIITKAPYSWIILFGLLSGGLLGASATLFMGLV